MTATADAEAAANELMPLAEYLGSVLRRLRALLCAGAREWHPVMAHDVHFDVPSSQRCGDLEADETRADDDSTARPARRPNDAACVC